MLSAAARQLAPALLRHEGAAAAPLRRLASAAAPTKPEEEDEYFELLPPGCSMKDPTYHYGRNSLSDPVLNYDQKPVEDYKPLKKRQPVPAPPLNVAAAKAKLDEKAVEKKKAQGAEQEEDDDMYVYLPPGSSMRDPLPSSLSDPLDNRRVYYRDPNPTLRK